MPDTTQSNCKTQLCENKTSFALYMPSPWSIATKITQKNRIMSR